MSELMTINCRECLASGEVQRLMVATDGWVLVIACLAHEDAVECARMPLHPDSVQFFAAHGCDACGPEKPS